MLHVGQKVNLVANGVGCGKVSGCRVEGLVVWWDGGWVCVGSVGWRWHCGWGMVGVKSLFHTFR